MKVTRVKRLKAWEKSCWQRRGMTTMAEVRRSIFWAIKILAAREAAIHGEAKNKDCLPEMDVGGADCGWIIRDMSKAALMRVCHNNFATGQAMGRRARRQCSAAMGPAFASRERPSVPCSIIRFPETWRTVSVVPISELIEAMQRATARRSGFVEEPLRSMPAVTALSV